MKLKDWEGKESEPTLRDGSKNHTDNADRDSGDLGTPDTGIGEPVGGAGQELRKRASAPKRDTEGEEELAPMPPWAKALTFLGLTVLAAILCAVLWHFTHPAEPGEGEQGSLAQAGQPEEDAPDRSLEPDGGPTSKPEDEAGGQPDSSPTPEPTEAPIPDTSADSEKESAENAGTAPDSQASAQPDASGSQPEPTQPTGQPQATAQPQPTNQPEAGDQPQAGNQEAGTGDMRMTFMDVQESVTPKDAVNLRTMPTTTDDRNIVVKIPNGEALSRTGINADTGWSRIDYNGQILYAVSQYLTTDLNYKTPVAPIDPNYVMTADGTVVIFENCDDWITPKEYVNLRTEPSTLQEDATVSCQLNYGENAHRTGFSADFGWSRVEYNGQVLYVVTSFVYTVRPE